MALTIRQSFAAATASLAALSMAAVPAAAAAAALPSAASFTPHTVDTDAMGVQHDSNGYYGHRWHHDDGIDAGDVIAGILVLGGIAAIASAASSHKSDNTRYRNTDYHPQDNRQPDYNSSDYNSQGMGRAVDMCTQQVERGRYQVSGVDHATRNADGWFVAGTVRDGRQFTCRIGNDGRLQDVSIGDHGGYSANDAPSRYRSASAAPGQLSNQAYARARAEVGSPSRDSYSHARQSAAATQDARPAYPGGPVPGQPSYATQPEPQSSANSSGGTYYDGRYTTAQSPDFSQTSYSPAG